MSGCMEFDYYYGIEAEQFSFYRIPKVLVKDGRFQALSSDAKLLYGLMLDRMSLSMKNGWLDGKNRAYIYYTLENIMEDLGCGKAKCVKILSELDNRKGIGLIEKKRQGLGRPDIIYVKNFATLESGAGQKNMDGNILGCSCQDVDRPDTDTQVQYADNPDTFFPAQDVDGFCHDDQFMDENIPDPAIPMQAKTIFKEDHSDGCGGFSESEIYAQLMELHNHGDIDGNSRTGEPEIRIDGSLATGSLEVRKPNLQKFENRTSGSLETVDIGTENWNFDRMQAGQTMEPGMDGIGKQDTHGQNNNILRVQAAKFEEVRKSNFKKSENQTSRSLKIELQEVRKSNFKKSENETCRSLETELAEVTKSNPNDTKNIYTEWNDIDVNHTDRNDIEDNDTDTIVSHDANPIHPSYQPGICFPCKELCTGQNDDSGLGRPDEMTGAESYMGQIRKNIEYEHFMQYGDIGEKGLFEDLYGVICAVVCADCETIRIGSVSYPHEMVRERFLKLNRMHIEYVISCFKKSTGVVHNINEYLKVSLFNSVNTMDSYYQQAVQHDMYGGGWVEKGVI